MGEVSAAQKELEEALAEGARPTSLGSITGSSPKPDGPYGPPNRKIRSKNRTKSSKKNIGSAPGHKTGEEPSGQYSANTSQESSNPGPVAGDHSTTSGGQNAPESMQARVVDIGDDKNTANDDQQKAQVDHITQQANDNQHHGLSTSSVFDEKVTTPMHTGLRDRLESRARVLQKCRTDKTHQFNRNALVRVGSELLVELIEQHELPALNSEAELMQWAKKRLVAAE